MLVSLSFLFKVDYDIISLDERVPLQTDVEESNSKGSNFNHFDSYSMVNGKNMSNTSLRQSNFGNLDFDEENKVGVFGNPWRANCDSSYPGTISVGIFSLVNGPGAKKKANKTDGGKDLHMF
ncbi:hypothetical protein V6N13_094792 [Hibiscus sabdariffa]